MTDLESPAPHVSGAVATMSGRGATGYMRVGGTCDAPDPITFSVGSGEIALIQSSGGTMINCSPSPSGLHSLGAGIGFIAVPGTYTVSVTSYGWLMVIVAAYGATAFATCGPTDQFTRIVSGDWNGPWTSTLLEDWWQGYAPAFSVSGGVGHVQAYMPGVDFTVYGPPWQFADVGCDLPVEYLVRFKIAVDFDPDDPFNDLDMSFYVYSKAQNMWGSVELYVDFDGLGTLVVDPIHHTAGSSPVYTPGSVSGWVDQWLWCRLRVEPYRSMAKVWKDGDSEPSGWNINERAYAIDGSQGYWFIVGANNTGTPCEISVDSVEVV